MKFPLSWIIYWDVSGYNRPINNATHSNVKMPYNQHKNSHYTDKTVLILKRAMVVKRNIPPTRGNIWKRWYRFCFMFSTSPCGTLRLHWLEDITNNGLAICYNTNKLSLWRIIYSPFQIWSCSVFLTFWYYESQLLIYKYRCVKNRSWPGALMWRPDECNLVTIYNTCGLKIDRFTQWKDSQSTQYTCKHTTNVLLT